MRPTFAIIFFTVVSGCGFGLLFVTALLCLFAPQSATFSIARIAVPAGMMFAAMGLASSLLHLGQPQRAWRALSQWRSSWLSREGVASILAFVPALALAYIVWFDQSTRFVRGISIVLAIMAFVTVVCTARIYTSLKTIRAWHNAWVLPGYLVFAGSGGACALATIAAARGVSNAMLASGAIVVFAIASALLKWFYWRFIDTYVGASTPESATGLGRIGKIHTFEQPHTEENYLTREMGFVLARKHAAKLRSIALILFAGWPILAASIAFGSTEGAVATFAYASATLSVIAGAFVERWLFFAQARHVVMLYYTRFENA